ncbi:alpha/beta hydrolase [Sphingomonas sp. MMS24-J13]|uniref:alpha/beta hydrolase n=1 Tax=Sphingomonas sp. MMS24-J13 TaxID=3238686 RepID=UPI00384C7C80
MDFNRRTFGVAAGALALAPLLARDLAAVAAAPAVSADSLARIDPELRAIARQMLAAPGPSPLTLANLPALRAGGAAYAPPRLPDVPVQERHIAGGRGMPEVTVYVVNADPARRRPGILHMHGGGFIAGAAKWEIGYLQDLARTLDCMIVTVEYRLAPEASYRGSIEDNYTGLRWMHAQAAELGLDPARIAVMGESAGGGHAALLALAARDRGEVPLVLQVLVYPMLDDRTGSSRTPPPFIGAVGWSAQSNQFGWRAFLGQAPGGASAPKGAVPARVEDLRGLPPAFIGVGGVDLFVDEDIAYAGRLIQAGVATELLVVPGAFHGFDRIAEKTSVASRFTRAKIDAIRRAFAPVAA